MTEFNPGDEVRVHEPQSQGGRWVFPGERLFVQEVNVRGHRAFVRCPAAYTAVWVDFENLMPPSPAVDMRALVDRVGHLERRLAKLEDVKNQGDELDTPEVVSCDCPHSDDDVHERGCVNHPTQKAAEPVDDLSWRDNPYSLPPATTEGARCPACSVQRRPHHLAGQLISHKTVLHADQATVEECVRRHYHMGFAAPELWKGRGENGPA